MTMPALGESVTEGTVTRWLKAEGDEVAVDEPLLEVSTDKVDTEIPSPVAGTLTKILVQEDDTVPSAPTSPSSAAARPPPRRAEPAKAPEPEPRHPSRQPEPAAEAPAAGRRRRRRPRPRRRRRRRRQEAAGKPADAERPPAQQSPEAAAPAAATPSRDDAAAYVTPLVRKLANQHGVDLGSRHRHRRRRPHPQAGRARRRRGRQGARPSPPRQHSRLRPRHRRPAAASAAPSATASVSPKRGTREKMTRLRKVIATRMVESLQVSAQLTTVVEVDLTKVARLRAKVKSDFEAREGTKLSFLPFLALAATEALKAHPMVNASIEGDEVVYHGSENLSIAVDTEKGLIVPVVKNAGDLNIAGLARAIADVAARTRSNKITPDDLAGGTFTITNTGSRGALFDTPIINQPQVAILGTGAIVKRPVVVTDADGGETIAIRSMMYLALSYDHRIVDGADAARFLGTMKARLEEGQFEA